ncbi:MAG: hypothetical protein DRQ59_10465 [Gammaproteobacteria bacterium]|nr:MAG: hypothetical protein DRQ59_10465 [Gammaproteobacteria bacterium]
MKKVMLIGALIATFASSNLYAATCIDTGADGYDDDCDATMRLDIPTFAVIAFPAAGGTGGSDLSVTWDGSTAGTATDSINICIGSNSDTGVDVTATSANATSFSVNDGTTDVAYTLTLDGNDLTDGAESIAAADATDLLCTVSDIPLALGFSNATLAGTPTDGTTPFTDVVTITVAPQ